MPRHHTYRFVLEVFDHLFHAVERLAADETEELERVRGGREPTPPPLSAAAAAPSPLPARIPSPPTILAHVAAFPALSFSGAVGAGCAGWEVRGRRRSGREVRPRPCVAAPELSGAATKHGAQI